MSNSQRPIDLTKQLFASTLPKWAAFAALVAALTMGYTKVATTDYVNGKAHVADAEIAKLAKAQKTTDAQVKSLAESSAKTDKRMDLVVRLVSHQYIEHVDAEEGRSRKKKPRSSKAKRMAAALQIDPDDPLAGLELIDP